VVGVVVVGWWKVNPYFGIESLALSGGHEKGELVLGLVPHKANFVLLEQEPQSPIERIITGFMFHVTHHTLISESVKPSPLGFLLNSSNSFCS